MNMPAELNPGAVFSPLEASRFLNISTPAVLARIHRGKLRAKEVEGRYFISGSEILYALERKNETAKDKVERLIAEAISEHEVNYHTKTV